MQFRHANLFLVSVAGLGFIPSCTVEPNDDIAEAIDPVQGCTGTGTAVNDMVCGVGVSANGYLAVNFRTRWWALDFNNGFWAVENNVVAAAANVTPTYTVTDDAICNCQCDPTQQGYPQCQQACSNACLNVPHMYTERLTYAVRVGGLDYQLEARQHIMDLRATAANSVTEARTQRSLLFEARTLDPDDGNPWTAQVVPRLAIQGGSSSGTITVVSGTYGGNVGAPYGNVTGTLASACNGLTSCTYIVDYTVIGDPVPNQAKDYVAQWRCGSSTTVQGASAPPEAGFRSPVTLSCPTGGGVDQQAVNETLTSGTIQTGPAASLVTSSNVDYTSDVELAGAVKGAATSTPQMIARANVAMNRALDAALPAGSAFQQHYIPEAIQSLGTVAARTPKAGGAGLYSMTRFNQFYMDNRKGQAGWSTQGTGEQPLAESGPRTWAWRHQIFSYNVHFPFLAGICGLDAGVSSYINGSLTYGRQSCFDGIATAIDAAGKLEFGANGYGAFGCNLLVAAAQAGLEARMRAGFEFNTHLQTLPPRLTGAVDIYSDLDFYGFFRARVLFWSHKWEKRIAGARLFQKHAEYSLAPTLADPHLQICDASAAPNGSCSDPDSVCDITGRCVRYNFASGSPERVDTGVCMYSGALHEFPIAIEGRQYIPAAIPGLPSTPGSLCSSTPPDARAAWTAYCGLPPSATTAIWPEPNPLSSDWFSGNDRYADVRPDRLRKTGVLFAGTMRVKSSGVVKIIDPTWDKSTSWSLLFDSAHCLKDAKEPKVTLSNPTVSGGVAGKVAGSYPFSNFAPDITQTVAIFPGSADTSGTLLRFGISVLNTNFPWHELILTWKGRSYGLRDWASACPGPSWSALRNVQSGWLDVELHDDPGDPKVFVNGARVAPDTFPPRVTGPSVPC